METPWERDLPDSGVEPPAPAVEELPAHAGGAAEFDLLTEPPADAEPPAAVEPDELGLIEGVDWGLSTGAEDLDLADVEPWLEQPAEFTVQPEIGPSEREEYLEDVVAGEAVADAEWAAPEAAGPAEELEPAADADTAPLEPAADADTAAGEEVAGLGAVLERVEATASPPGTAQWRDPRADALEHAARAEATLGEDSHPPLQEVAGRLERIARALREGRPIELFAEGSSDPLEVLIAGYAMGYSEAYRRAREERRGDS